MLEKSNYASQGAVETGGLFRKNYEDVRPLKYYDEGQLNDIIGTPFSSEPDDGPVEAWKWTHMDLLIEDVLQSEKLRYLRRRGYVMWDHSRLVRWGFFGQPWTKFSGDMPNGPLPYVDSPERLGPMERSWQRRKEFYERGVTGRWDDDDDDDDDDETRVQ